MNAAGLLALPRAERRKVIRATLLEVARRLPAVERTVEDVVNEYGTLLGREITLAWDYKVTESQFYADHVRWIRQFGIQAYVQGLLEGGVTQDEMDEEDGAAVNTWVGQQIAAARDFAKAVQDSSTDKDKHDAILGRLDLWMNALQALGSQGLMSAMRNAMGEWKLGKTEEHCTTCSSLNGKRHRLKWFREKGYIPREPGSETLECGGWNCDCGIYDVKSGAQLI